MCHYDVDRWIDETHLTIEPSAEPSAPPIPGTDWRIPTNRRYYTTIHFPLPPNTIRRQPLPIPGAPHPSRSNVAARPLNWRRGRHLQLLSPVLTPEPTDLSERLSRPAHFVHSIETIMSEPAPAPAMTQPTQTPRANSAPTPTAETPLTTIHDRTLRAASSPHPGSFTSGMSIPPLTPLPTPGLSRRHALPPPSYNPSRGGSASEQGSDSESSVQWDDEDTHGVVSYDDGDIERARNPPVEALDVSPRTVPGSGRVRWGTYGDGHGRVSRFVEHLDVSASVEFFD